MTDSNRSKTHIPEGENFDTIEEAVRIFNAQHDMPVTLGQALRVVALYLHESDAPPIVSNCWNLVGMSATDGHLSERDELHRILRLVTRTGPWEPGEWDNVLEIANAAVEKLDSKGNEAR